MTTSLQLDTVIQLIAYAVLITGVIVSLVWQGNATRRWLSDHERRENARIKSIERRQDNESKENRKDHNRMIRAMGRLEGSILGKALIDLDNGESQA